MNDRYLYRAKRKDNGEWIVGSLIQTSYLGSIRSWISSEQEDKARLREVSSNQAVWRAFEVRTDTICQCTGLKDKNGKLIWENDVIEAWSQGRCATGKIKHRIDGTWIMYPAWQNGEMWYLLPNDDGITTVEVIGNIFDNKELLESEDKDENNY